MKQKNKQMHKKLWITLIITVLAVIAAGFYIFGQDFGSEKNVNINNNKQLKNDKKTLDATIVPSGFPKDLPVEVGSKVLQNYEVTTNDGRILSFREVTTSKDLAITKELFRNFFISKDWTDVSVKNSTNTTSNILMRKGDSVLTISTKTDPTTKENSVAISLTETK